MRVCGAEGCLQQLLRHRRNGSQLPCFSRNDSPRSLSGCGKGAPGWACVPRLSTFMQARSILDGNFLVCPWNEHRNDSAHTPGAPWSRSSVLGDAERLGAKDHGARTILTGGIRARQTTRVTLARQAQPVDPGSAPTWLPSFPLAMGGPRPVVDLIPDDVAGRGPSRRLALTGSPERSPRARTESPGCGLTSRDGTPSWPMHLFYYGGAP